MQDRSGSVSYQQLLQMSRQVAESLLGEDGEDLSESRVAFLVPPGADYVAAQWGVWRAGGVAVPLSLSATEAELEYTLTDSGVSQVLVAESHESKVVSLCDRLGVSCLRVEEAQAGPERTLPGVEEDRRAMILYTSGTTSKPKGVVTTHACIRAQIEALVEAWRWQPDDRIPLFLPLHHIHGIINVLSCALWTGAHVDVLGGFDSGRVLERVSEDAYTVFMAVPTIYIKMIEELEKMDETAREQVVGGFGRLRLMVSGSAALPASVHHSWSRLTGQVLLERYGMTEIGMALSNPFDGERRPGAVGQPLPGVEVRLVAEDGAVVAGEDLPGEIQVRGPNVFLEYWNREEATRESFQEGWFRTGDIAVLERGSYRILGRSSVDIIKSGGYKLSALEIETVLLDHPAIRECAVVGVQDETWGETVALAMVCQPGTELAPETLQAWCKERISHYKVPRRILKVESLPRNAMGKVTKPPVRDLFG